MDPTLLCALALVAADPAFDDQRAFAESPPALIYQIDDAMPFERTAAGGAFAAELDSTLPSRTEAIVRGQSPTFAQPVDPYLQNPPAFGAPAAAGIWPMQPVGARIGVFATYENVIVAPYFSQNTAAVTTGGPGTPTEVRQLEWDFDYSPRFEIGMVDAAGGGWRARYWHFDHSDRERGVVPPEAGARAFITPDAITGAGITAFPGESAEAIHSLRMSVLDAEIIKRGIGGDCGFDVSFGLRYARMDQWLRGRVTDAAGDRVESNALRHDFEGIGPTIAGEYRKPLWHSGWSVFGNARAALLYGDSGYRYDRRDDVADLLTDSSRNTSDRDLLGVFETQIGLEYRHAIFFCHELFIRGALEGQYWANAGSASADLTGGGSASAQDADLGFFGFTIATGLNW